MNHGIHIQSPGFWNWTSAKAAAVIAILTAEGGSAPDLGVMTSLPAPWPRGVVLQEGKVRMATSASWPLRFTATLAGTTIMPGGLATPFDPNAAWPIDFWLAPVPVLPAAWPAAGSPPPPLPPAIATYATSGLPVVSDGFCSLPLPETGADLYADVAGTLGIRGVVIQVSFSRRSDFVHAYVWAVGGTYMWTVSPGVYHFYYGMGWGAMGWYPIFSFSGTYTSLCNAGAGIVLANDWTTAGDNPEGYGGTLTLTPDYTVP